MAGAGYKLFQTGDVLTAAQVNTYLNEQTVMVFASAAARTTALTSVLAEGMVSYLQDTNAVEVYNGTAWTAVGGGLTSPLTTKGDIWGYSTTNARIPVGSNGTVLTADSAETLGVKWAAPAGGGGKVLQVVSTTKSDSFTSTSTSFADVTGLSVSITPSNASSKVLVLYNVSGSQAVAAQIARSRLMRDSTEINIGDTASTRARGTSDPFSVAPQIIGTTIAGSYLDSPATTSATTYKFQVATSGGTVYVNRSEDDSDSTIRSRTVSTITVMEIGA